MSDLNRMRGIADHAAHGAHLPPAADVRSRAERRRTRRAVAGGVLAVVAVAGVGIGLGGTDDENVGMPAGTPSPTDASTTPSETPTAPGEVAVPTNRDQFSPYRQVALMPVGTTSVLSVGGDGTGAEAAAGDPLVVSPTVDGRAALVGIDISEDSGFYILKTGAIQGGGETYCVDAAVPDAPTIAACDSSSDTQVFELRRKGRVDGSTTYVLVTLANGRLSLGADTYWVSDQGKASIPSLD